ncbi:ABC transporter ATP-binding protein [uncultured Tyzzerella sp.]|uniref:ABC transporter ATP-binding protein n=1 Tax=uncultured Tyzzerella sp. TaxID=2321398 RepID=UPI0029429CB8|nr:ABC transporter ATP-binding protein [uncultured Tyzzerella sp.]
MDYIRLENISKSYDNIGIIDDINFSFKKGKIVSFLGKSGVGKTTLFNILAGFEKADTGKIFLQGEDITNKKKNISYMTQKHLLLPYLNVLDNVCLSFKIKGINKKLAYEKAIPILEKFGLSQHINKYPNELSGGMKQRVSFIRAYLKESDLMLFDEPFSALDSITKESIYEWFKQMIKYENKTTVFITHDINEAIYLSDKIYILSKKPANIVLSLDINNNVENFRTSNEFLLYYKEITDCLKKYLEEN